MRLDVKHHGTKAGRLGQTLPVLDAVLSGRGDQHFNVAHRGLARPDDAKIQADFVERERDVLVGFGFDLNLELFLAKPCGEHDLLGDDRGLRHGHHHVLGLAAALGDDSAHRVSNLFELLDLAVGDPALLETLGGKTLQNVVSRIVLTQLNELDARRADVESDHRRMLAA